MGILCKARRVLYKETLKNLYFTFIYPYLIFCVHVWGNSAKTHLDHLQKLQKNCNLITFSKFNSHTEPLMYELNFLNIVKIHLFAVGIFMFKYWNKDLPDVFKSMFSYRCEIHAFNTRGAIQLHLEQFPTNIGLKGLRYFGAKLWNAIFLSFTYINCVDLFKARFKGTLLDSIFLEENMTSCIWRKKLSLYHDIGILALSFLGDHQNIMNINWMWILLTVHLFILSSKMLKRT